MTIHVNSCTVINFFLSKCNNCNASEHVSGKNDCPEMKKKQIE